MTLSQTILELTIFSTSIASCVMSMLVLGCYIFFKDARKEVEFFMISMNSLGNLIMSLTLGISIYLPAKPGFWCNLEGICRQLGYLMSFAWSAIIAYSLKMSIMQMTPQQKMKKYQIMFMMGFIGPLIIALLPLYDGFYKQYEVPDSNHICFIKADHDDHGMYEEILYLLCFFLPLIFTFTFNFTCMYQVILKYKKKTNDPDFSKQLSRLLYYPFILIICQVCFFIERLMYLVSPGDAPTSFMIFCFGTSNLNGFFDGLAYGLNTIKEVRQSKNKISSLSDSVISVGGGENSIEDPQFNIQASRHSTQSINPFQITLND